MCWKIMFGLGPLGPGIGAAGASDLFPCWFAWRISFCDGGCRSGIGTAMPNGVFGLSTALRGLFSYTWPPPSGFTFSLLFCLFRENVDMVRAGLEALDTALGTCAFSGE
jgi:hypothetical protein